VGRHCALPRPRSFLLADFSRFLDNFEVPVSDGYFACFPITRPHTRGKPRGSGFCSYATNGLSGPPVNCLNQFTGLVFRLPCLTGRIRPWLRSGLLDHFDWIILIDACGTPDPRPGFAGARIRGRVGSKLWGCAAGVWVEAVPGGVVRSLWARLAVCGRPVAVLWRQLVVGVPWSWAVPCGVLWGL
jgi:hypothetical protein